MRAAESPGSIGVATLKHLGRCDRREGCGRTVGDRFEVAKRARHDAWRSRQSGNDLST